MVEDLNKDYSKEMSFLWIDGKIHNVSVSDGNELVNMQEIRTLCKKQKELKKEQCDKIYFLGLCLTGSPELAEGFLTGWLIKSIKDAAESSGNFKWTINHSIDDVSKEELRSFCVKYLRDMADVLEKKENFTLPKNPFFNGDIDGTDQF